jgi:hypothetical protein
MVFWSVSMEVEFVLSSFGAKIFSQEKIPAERKTRRGKKYIYLEI